MILRLMDSGNVEIFDKFVSSFCELLTKSKTAYTRTDFLDLLIENVSSRQGFIKHSHLWGFGKIMVCAFNNLPETIQRELINEVKNSIQESTTISFKDIFIVYCALYKSNKNDSVEDFEILESFLIKTGNESRNDVLQTLIGLSLALLVNRYGASPKVESLLEDFDNSNVLEHAIGRLSWIVKGCVSSWQPNSPKFLSKLIECLTNDQTAPKATEGFELLCCPNDPFIEAANWSKKLMSRQRFSQFVLPQLVQLYHEGSDLTRSCILKSISFTLQATPKKILMPYLNKLVPLLLHSLEKERGENVLASTITTIISLTNENQQVIQDHIQTLIGRLLNVVTHDRMKVRIAALQCLMKLSTYKYHDIVPLKKDVVKRIAPLLDDKKRLVRKEAVSCSKVWHLVA